MSIEGKKESVGRTARWLLLLLLIASPARAIVLQPGDLVVTDTLAKALLRVDPVSGQRERIARLAKTPPEPPMKFPWDLLIDADHRIVISDMDARGIFAIDPETGGRTVLSGRGVGSGPPFRALRGIAFDGAGGLYAVDTGKPSHRIFHVDLATGDRRVLSGAGVGSGPPLDFPHDLVVEASGALLVNVKARSALYRIDPRTGDRSVVSDATVGSGPELQHPFGMALTADGEVLLTDREHRTIHRVDPKTGDRTLISSDEIGSGPRLKAPFGVAEAADGTLFVVDLGTWAIYRVDPTTGERRVVSSREVGEGDIFQLPRNLVIVPRPASAVPPGLVLFAVVLGFLGAGGWLARGLRRRRSARPARKHDLQDES